MLPAKEIRIRLNAEDARQISSSKHIAKACLFPNIFAYDIYSGDALVGFAMLKMFEEHSFFLWNFAIDDALQGKGYGEKALQALILF